MKLNSLINKNISIILIILLISLYHFLIHNGLEKIFNETYFKYNDINRPLEICVKNKNGQSTNCIGMPSGHAETITIIASLLYLYKLIPLWICMLLILVISYQRVISKFHTIFQITVGIFLGVIYTLIYKSLNLSIFSFIIVFCVGLILALLCVYKLDKQIYGPIPTWVDIKMIKSIKKKQNIPLYLKVCSIYANSLIQNITFISWRQLENYLDIIIERIKLSGKKYDAVVGIKTGGAILSDYISLKLELPNYKVKLSRKEYNCNKTPHNLINDIFQKKLLNNLGEFTVCEGIDDNLEGKNIILIDELVSSGKTMSETYNYLKNEKQVNEIYVTTISLCKKTYDDIQFKINYVLPKTVLIWCWGYDN